jgi:L-rhamnonate dehydratase
LFLDEPIPTKGFLTAADLDKPGFGLTLNPAARAKLIPSAYLLSPPPMASLSPPAEAEAEPVKNGTNGTNGTEAAVDSLKA